MEMDLEAQTVLGQPTGSGVSTKQDKNTCGSRGYGTQSSILNS